MILPLVLVAVAVWCIAWGAQPVPTLGGFVFAVARMAMVCLAFGAILAVVCLGLLAVGQ